MTDEIKDEHFVRDNINSADSSGSNMSRRDFLKLSGLLCLGAAIPPSSFGGKERIFGDNSYESIGNSYLADSGKSADEIARLLRMNNMASASNICGPLATAILLRWKLNPDGTIHQELDEMAKETRLEGVIPTDMWLGSPTTEPDMFRKAFPAQHYQSFHLTEDIGTMNFNNIPEVGELLPGDFLYLDGGSFTHYIAITKKDHYGRIFCVSNVHGEKKDEFLIKELLLWDPVTEAGYFREWSKGVGPEKATTGKKGFYLWRREKNTENILDDAVSQKYRDYLLNEMRLKSEGSWQIYISDLLEGDFFEWRNGNIYHSASTIKVPLAILALQQINREFFIDIQKFGLNETLKTKGFAGRSFEQLISAILVNSEEEATDSIAKYLKSNNNLSDCFKALNMNMTSYEPRRTTQKDMFSCWRNLFTGEIDLDLNSRRYLIRKLQEYTPSDDKFFGVIKKQIPSARIWNKRGTITSEFVNIQDSGVVEIPSKYGSRFFYIGIAGLSTSTNRLPYVSAIETFDKIVKIFCSYILELNDNTRAKSLQDEDIKPGT